jgi:NAD(P)-dependent dehydrogenase (short-subunit alcohol dehydrogenase family)
MADRTGWERRPAFTLVGKRALVLGVETAAGAAVAAAFAEAGATVAAIATGPDEGASAAYGCSAVWDAGRPESIADGMSTLVREFGPPVILVTALNAPYAAPIQETSDAEYARVMSVNLGSVFAACREFLRHFPADASNGRIICVTTDFGQRGVDHLSAYGAAHGGVHNLVRVLAQETGALRGLTVNAVATGWMSDTAGRGPDELGANRLMRFIPMRRFGDPAEVAPLALLLAGEGSNYITGQILHVDGGVQTHL